jgi:hypothetical protein
LLDRLISGAGAVTDLADRAARLVTGRVGREVLGSRPGSPIVAGLLVVAAVVLGLVGAESSGDPNPRPLQAVDIADDPDLATRTYATVEGVVHGAYVETYIDVDGDAQQDPGESGQAWYYFLVDPTTHTGLTVRSSRTPEDVFVLDVVGRLVADPTYVADDLEIMKAEIAGRDLTIDPTYLIDTTDPTVGDAIPLDLANPPSEGTVVSLSASTLSYAGPSCEGMETDLDCLDADERFYDVILFDPATDLGIIVYTTRTIEFVPATFTGLLRRDEHAVDDARTTPGLEFATLALSVSDRYVLDDGASPANPMIAYGVAGLCLLIAGLIIIGWAGGYLVYRREPGGLPMPAAGLAPGERIPLRVTGLLRSSAGLIHVRETPGDLVRYVTSPPPPTVSADVGEPVTTLIAERRGRPEGVALGLGETRRLTAGSVMPLRGPRPALRIVAGTGPIMLSFDDATARDRAAAALLDESGLVSTGGVAIEAPMPHPDAVIEPDPIESTEA